MLSVNGVRAWEGYEKADDTLILFDRVKRFETLKKQRRTGILD